MAGQRRFNEGVSLERSPAPDNTQYGGDAATPAARGERGGGRIDFGERSREELLLVEGGDDDRNFHAANVTAAARLSTAAAIFRNVACPRCV